MTNLVKFANKRYLVLNSLHPVKKLSERLRMNYKKAPV